MKRRSPATRELPLLPLRGMLVFPHMTVHLEVGREKSLSAVNEAMLRDHVIVLAAQKETTVEQPEPQDIQTIGTLAEVKQLVKLPTGTYRVLVSGTGRVRIEDFLRNDPFFRVQAVELDEASERTAEIEATMRAVGQQFDKFVKVSRRLPAEAVMSVSDIADPGRFADTIAAQLHLVLKMEDKQAILERANVGERLLFIGELISREIEIIELERKISLRVKKQMEKTQKEYYLREQLKAIHQELGEKEDRASEVEEYKEKLKALTLPEAVREKADKELERLEKMPPMAAEAVVVRTYLDWIIALPWLTETTDRLDISAAEAVLEEDHYGLEKVKERILEYLAIRQLAQNMRGPILCLVGPPGTGKTSLAKSVARALDRKFVRISLGGVRDEAEIRGHRRTYVGALPGRILQGMKQAGSRNPVFLMDEVDKLTSDFRGDPAAALLEVLDPEQNHSFSDHYMELAFDLSKVLFITTANTTYTIPRALLDRMETIYLSGYTEPEKVHIAQGFILPRVLKEHGLGAKDLEFTDGAIRQVIERHTREAGVRNLEREISAVSRKVAREIVEGRKPPVKVTAQNVHQYLGAPRFRVGSAEEKDQIGVATGVAVTDAGGDIMPVEVSAMPGKGNLILTGKLGEVMRESAQAAMSYVRSRSRDFGLSDDFHERQDLHVHIPEGALPKEGPSAGIAIGTALISALCGRPVRRDVAMTGEITLRGRILPVGGVKEKVLGAHRAGIANVILPRENEKDLEEVPAEVRRKMTYILVEHMDEVLATALVGGLEALVGGPPLEARGETADAVPGGAADTDDDAMRGRILPRDLPAGAPPRDLPAPGPEAPA
jgi:ATP-dependent Lon protease